MLKKLVHFIFVVQFKFSAYSAATGKVDTDKLWGWINAKF